MVHKHDNKCILKAGCRWLMMLSHLKWTFGFCLHLWHPPKDSNGGGVILHEYEMICCSGPPGHSNQWKKMTELQGAVLDILSHKNRPAVFCSFTWPYKFSSRCDEREQRDGGHSYPHKHGIDSHPIPELGGGCWIHYTSLLPVEMVMEMLVRIQNICPVRILASWLDSVWTVGR